MTNTRLLQAPRAQVHRAFREPERLARWWGPEGFRSTFSEFDFRPGGDWVFVMHGPDGTDYPNHNVFGETGPERIVVRHPAAGHEFTLTVLLEEEGDATRIRWHQCFASVEHFAQIRDFVQEANEQNLDRLEAELQRMQGA